MVDRMVEQGVIIEEYRQMLLVDDEPGRLLERMHEWRLPQVAKWLRADEDI